MDEKISTEIEYVFLESLDPGCLPALAKELKSGTIRILADLKEILFPDSHFVQLQHPEYQNWLLNDRGKAKVIETCKQPFQGVPTLKK